MLHGDLQVPMPPMVQGIAPIDINVYTDGGLSHPRSPQFGLASAGVYWPHRPQEVDAYVVTELEREYGQVSIEGTSVVIKAALRGLAPSSARAELFGVIIAMLSSLPVHAGLDNLSVV